MTTRVSRHAAYHELVEQLARPGCAFCALGARAAARSLESLCGEMLLDPPVRSRLRASLGFCAAHAHALDATAPRLTVAILYEDFLQHAEGELDAWTQPRRRPSPQTPCPACQAVEQQEEEIARLMATFIEDPEMAAAYEASSGLCLPHTIVLCRRASKPARCRIVARERERIRHLRAELAAVIRKHDYRFRDEPWGDEKSAPGRAVKKIAGDRPVTR
jgi:hypothetical protein